MNFFNKSGTTSLAQELEITRPELENILEQSVNPVFRAAGREVVSWDKDSIMNQVNTKLAQERAKLNSENLESTSSSLSWDYNRYLEYKKTFARFDLKGDAMWEKFRKKELVKDIINDKTDLNNSNISNVNEFLRINKDIVNSELKVPTTENKPLGSVGDITINELITKGLDIIDTPLVQMLKDHLDVAVVGSFISSMIVYKAVMKIYIKAINSQGPNAGLDLVRFGPSTRSKEIALFMLAGAPAIAGTLMAINYATKIGTKVFVNVLDSTGSGSTGSEGSNSASSAISNSSLFLFLKKLPSWIKVILKYIAISIIITFITSVIGYKSNIISEITSQINMYLVIILKFYSILNFLVFLYFIWKVYVIKMFENNKEYLNPENYINFIKIELQELKEFTIKLPPIELKKLYKYYYLLIILYFSIVLLCLTGVVIISMYN